MATPPGVRLSSEGAFLLNRIQELETKQKILLSEFDDHILLLRELEKGFNYCLKNHEVWLESHKGQITELKEQIKLILEVINTHSHKEIKKRYPADE